MESKGSILMHRYELGKLLGQGTFAKVYHARDIKTGTSVAIKVIDKEKIVKVGMMDQIKREISVMRLVRHPNIVQLYEVMASKAKIYFVMEYGVYHRDLKPENLLLDENGDLKISDFGLSAFAESKRQDGLLHTTCGTPAYVAPEVINRRGYDGSKADIWSCGVILFVLLAGHLPFHDSNLMEMYRKIGKAEFKCPNWIPPDARKLISKILDPNPNTRISISKIMQNSWFRKGFQSRTARNAADLANGFTNFTEAIVNADATVDFTDNSNGMADMKGELAKPVNLNAFEIISLSAGFDLSGLFEDNDKRKEYRFTSNQPAKTIISKLEELAKHLKLKVMKKDGGIFKLEGSKAGRKGVLSIDAEIFEVAPTFHLVEMKKSNGDTLEYQKLMKEDVGRLLKTLFGIGRVMSLDTSSKKRMQSVSYLSSNS
ncbi:UNVERIFIED_CONTAM: CBL-interacting protein kinase [Sesamum angustifolium]|uniref:non-specific serine/threonine protein kinase n=1 Tax=Sesamum angustifolium TaxID=2727405 RepID=A0AAW2N554_9LAMI